LFAIAAKIKKHLDMLLDKVGAKGKEFRDLLFKKRDSLYAKISDASKTVRGYNAALMAWL
jgi:hypothetical protein